MARRSKAADSGTEENKTKFISGDKPEFVYKRDRAQIMDFAKQIEYLQRNPTKNYNKTFTLFNKETVKTYLQNPATNQDTLREISRFLCRYSMLYQKMIMHYATIPLFNYNIMPNDDFTQDYDIEQIVKNYQKAITEFNKFDIKKEEYNALYFAIRDGFYVGYIYQNKQAKTFLMPLDVQYCRIIGKNQDGQWVVYFNAAYFDAGSNKELVLGVDGKIETATWDQIFIDGYNQYKNGGRDYQWFRLDPSKTQVLLTCADDEFYAPIPFFAPLFVSLMDLIDLEQIVQAKNELENYKLLISKIPLVDKGQSGDIDDFAISLELSRYFNELLAQNVPEQVAVGYSPMDIEVINFEKSNSADSTDKLSDAINNLFENAGASKVAVSGGGTNPSTLAIKYGMIEDQDIVWVWVNRIESWLNYFIKENIVKGFTLEIHKISDFNREEYINIRKEAATLGNNKMSYITAVEESPFKAMQKLRFENAIGLTDMMIPLQSSYNGGSTNSEGGRPTTSDDELSPSGDRTRNTTE